MNQAKLILVTLIAFFVMACNATKVIETITPAEEVMPSKKVSPLKYESLSFSYENITGIGEEANYNRRDNSDIIKVGDTYYVWYTRMDSPVTSGYWGTVWYATSTDEGHNWEEQGMAIGLGAAGEFDAHSVFTPNILAYKGKYYLYYTGIGQEPVKTKTYEDITAIGLAVSDSPDGPFVKVKNNPVLEISEVATDFDSYRIDDSALMVKDNKIWLYYKGRAFKKTARKTKMSVAYADKPDGPFTKNEGFLLDGSHEVLIWKKGEGVVSLASLHESLNFAADGKQFTMMLDSLTNLPKAPGLYRPHLNDGNPNWEIPGWGVCMRNRKGVAYLTRFEMK